MGQQLSVKRVVVVCSGGVCVRVCAVCEWVCAGGRDSKSNTRKIKREALNEELREVKINGAKEMGLLIGHALRQGLQPKPAVSANAAG